MIDRQPIPPVRRVLLYPREDGPAAFPAAAVATTILRARGVDVAVPQVAFERGLELPSSVVGVALDQPAQLADLDLVVALGGDGTLLRASRWVADLNIPVVGVNLGDLGFLSAYRRERLESALHDAVEGALRWEPRLRMTVEVHRDGELVATDKAVNDVYIKHGQIPRLLRLDTRVGDEQLAMYKADGLIVSTPLGSTAYNLAAGGPIIAPGTEVFTITAICPHSLTLRPVVVSAQNTVSVSWVGPSGESDAFLTVDGQFKIELQLGDRIVLTVCESVVRLVPSQANVFQVLATKMGWTVAPGSDSGSKSAF
ncbi:ATP-NAD kinase [Plesiocystis pacifica SIR-1]|uniref:NAD kinase n=1 Tax=Plesiocystis pacifica SIR-1 TaxID=391625 RepID=A6G2K1_9BACT|nr:NAD(+)/NADH kinase [Plesiocystis pacifica]EDM79938.1 ATP-NAD kinase [Plesiocystis pacifica SIR-1]